jgi:hypothetical protein
MESCLSAIFIRPFVILWEILWGFLRLIPYVLGILLIWFLFNYFGWGNTDFLGDLTAYIPFVNQPAATQTETGGAGSTETANRTYPIIFRIIWQGDRIYHLGNEISEEHFYELARQAKSLGGKVEIQQSSDVTFEVANRRRTVLNEIGVNYEIINV